MLFLKLLLKFIAIYLTIGTNFSVLQTPFY